jgi:hypothetical protein
MWTVDSIAICSILSIPIFLIGISVFPANLPENKRYGHWELKARYMSSSGILVERKQGRFQEIKLLLKDLSSGNRAKFPMAEVQFWYSLK